MNNQEPNSSIDLSRLLPQHRPSACEPFYPYIEQALKDHTRPFVIKYFRTAQVTFVARFRDALNAIGEHNWPAYPPNTLDIVKTFIVSSQPDSVLVGKGEVIRAFLKAKKARLLPGPLSQETVDRIEMTTIEAIEWVCSLLHNGCLNPQPIFFTTLPLNEPFIAFLNAKYTNVLITADPTNPQHTQFV